MKRSEMVSHMAEFLWQKDQSANPDLDWWFKVADELLREQVLKHGMLPPKCTIEIPSKPGIKHTVTDYFWEKE